MSLANFSGGKISIVHTDKSLLCSFVQVPEFLSEVLVQVRY